MITLTRTPRGTVEDTYNFCTNPSFEVNMNGWAFLWSGDSGAATDARSQSQYASPSGGYMLTKTWTTKAASSATFAGFEYGPYAWPAGVTRSIRGKVSSIGHSQKMAIQVNWYAADGTTAVGQATSPSAVINAGGGASITFQNVVAPAGAVTAKVRFGIAGDSVSSGYPVPAVGDAIWLDQVMISPEVVIPNYFDGDTAASGSFTYGWWGAAGASASTRFLPDPASIITPDMVLGYDTSRAARNTVHQFLSGNVGATQLPASLRSGTLRLFFQDPAKAATAEKVHAGAGTFAFTDTDWPTEAMTYVVNGPVRSYQDDTRRRRILEVPYAEITP